MKLAIETSENNWETLPAIHHDFRHAHDFGVQGKKKFLIAERDDMLRRMIEYECQMVSFGVIDDLLRHGRESVANIPIRGRKVSTVQTIVEESLCEIRVAFEERDVECHCLCVRVSGLIVSMQYPHHCRWELKSHLTHEPKDVLLISDYR